MKSITIYVTTDTVKVMKTVNSVALAVAELAFLEKLIDVNSIIDMGAVV